MTVRPQATLALLALVFILILVVLVLGRCNQTHRTNERTEKATSRALDNVATQTPIIRQDQQEREREVDQIEGSDQRLPDGYGAELERLRMRDRRNP